MSWLCDQYWENVTVNLSGRLGAMEVKELSERQKDLACKGVKISGIT